MGKVLQSLGILYEFGSFLQSVTLTVAQGAELGNSLPTPSVLCILYLRESKFKQGEGVSGSGDRHRLRAVQQHPDKRSHVTQVRHGEKLGVP